jgi:hypothetical protein
MRLNALLLAVAVVTGCSDQTPSRMTVPADTVIVNTTLIEPLDVHVVDRDGAVIRGRAIRYSTTSRDSTLEIRGGNAIQCRRDGVALVRVTAGRFTDSVAVRCDIIERIIAEELVCTRIGDPPIPLSVAAFDAEGREISNPRLYIRADSSFVRIGSGFITPLKSGDGDIEFTNGRHRATTLIRVLDTGRVVSARGSRVIKARDRMFEGVCGAR